MVLTNLMDTTGYKEATTANTASKMLAMVLTNGMELTGTIIKIPTQPPPLMLKSKFKLKMRMNILITPIIILITILTTSLTIIIIVIIIPIITIIPLLHHTLKLRLKLKAHLTILLIMDITSPKLNQTLMLKKMEKNSYNSTVELKLKLTIQKIQIDTDSDEQDHLYINSA